MSDELRNIDCGTRGSGSTFITRKNYKTAIHFTRNSDIQALLAGLIKYANVRGIILKPAVNVTGARADLCERLTRLVNLTDPTFDLIRTLLLNANPKYEEKYIEQGASSSSSSNVPARSRPAEKATAYTNLTDAEKRLKIQQDANIVGHKVGYSTLRPLIEALHNGEDIGIKKKNQIVPTKFNIRDLMEASLQYTTDDGKKASIPKYLENYAKYYLNDTKIYYIVIGDTVFRSSNGQRNEPRFLTLKDGEQFEFVKVNEDSTRNFQRRAKSPTGQPMVLVSKDESDDEEYLEAVEKFKEEQARDDEKKVRVQLVYFPYVNDGEDANIPKYPDPTQKRKEGEGPLHTNEGEIIMKEIDIVEGIMPVMFFELNPDIPKPLFTKGFRQTGIFELPEVIFNEQKDTLTGTIFVDDEWIDDFVMYMSIENDAQKSLCDKGTRKIKYIPEIRKV